MILRNGREICGGEEEVLRLAAFFDLFDYPLSLLEISGRICSGSDLSGLLELLARLVSAGSLAESDGFYYLPGREAIIETRRRRYNYARRKIRKAERFARAFSLFPPVRMVALANSIGRYNLRDGSDIDFFIITAPRRIWLSRLFCTGLAKALNSRPDAKTKRDRICLSFYLSEDNMALEPLKLEGGDPYFDFWESSLFFLAGDDSVFARFKAANGGPAASTPGKGISSGLSGRIGDRLEKAAGYFQKMIMPGSLEKAAAPSGSSLARSSGVVIGDGILKLYLGDKRLEIRKRYEENLGKAI